MVLGAVSHYWLYFPEIVTTKNCGRQLDITTWLDVAPSEDHSNTSVLHMHDQRFSKHTLNTISPRQEKHPLNENFARFCPKINP